MVREDPGVRWKAGLILAGVFLSGAVLGVAADRLLPDASAAPAQEERDREEPQGLIVEQVGLSAEQQWQVDSVVKVHRARMDSAAREYRTVYWELVQGTRKQLKQLLSTEQAATYDSLLAEADRERRERHRAEEEREGGAEGGQR